MASVVWREEALEDLRQIRAYIRQFDRDDDARIRAALIDCGRSLTAFPRRGRPAGGNLREMVTVPPYVLTCAVEDDIVHIVELRHGANLPRTRA